MKRLSAALLFAALASISAHALDLPLPLAQAAPPAPAPATPADPAAPPAAAPTTPPQPPQPPRGAPNPNPNGLPPGLPPGMKLPPGVTLPPLPPGMTPPPGMPSGAAPGQMPPGMPGAPGMPPGANAGMPPGMSGMPGANPNGPGPRSNFPRQAPAGASWTAGITQAVGNLGQGNWIVIADAAFPFFSAPAIQTAPLPAESADVLKHLVEDLNGAKHLKATVYTESEFSGVTDAAAPGASAQKEQVATILKDAKPQALSQAALIAKIQEASKTYRVLVVKTTTKLPYSAIFIELATNPRPAGEAPAPAAAPSKPAGEPAAKPKPKK